MIGGGTVIGANITFKDNIHVGVGSVFPSKKIKIDKRKKYEYIPDFGPKVVQNGKETYSGETLAALSGHQSYSDKSVKESRVLMKRLIDYYIQPKKIKTREILKYISL